MTSGKVKRVTKKQQKKGLNVSFAAVFWDITQCSPKEMAASICINPLGIEAAVNGRARDWCVA